MFIRNYFWPEPPALDMGNQLIDIQRIQFDLANETHHAYLSLKLEHFKATRDKLVDMDQKIAAAVGVCTLLWMGGLNGYLTVAGYAGIYYVASQQYHRGETQKAFDQSLNELYSLYRWTMAGRNQELPPHAMAMKLRDAIKPFAQETMVTNKWSHLFATTKDAVKLTWYGHRFADENNEQLVPQFK